MLSRNKCVVVAGKTYLVLEEIGRGGSSKVYRILAPDLQIYALKKIKLKQLDQSNIQQYENEISLLKKLQGKEHIIRLVAADTDLKQKVIHVVHILASCMRGIHSLHRLWNMVKLTYVDV